jgi:predicted transcriptional regulator
MKNGQLDKMLQHTELMFEMAPKVSRDESATSVNQIIDALPTVLADNEGMQTKMYTLITNDLKKNNQFLWFKTSLRLSKNLLANGGEAEMK